MRVRWFLTIGAVALASSPLFAQSKAPRIGIISGAMGSFAATILKSHQTPFENVTAKLSTDSLANYGLLVVDNLFKLQDIAGPAFKDYVERGGVLLIINPKVDGFSRTWSPYDIFAGDYTLEAKIADKKHPLFKGFTDDKLKDFAVSNGPFVGNCSLAEPGKEWKVLAKQSKNGKNPVIIEAGYGAGWFIVTCTRFDQYNAKPAVTRYGDNLMAYAMAKIAAGR